MAAPNYNNGEKTSEPRGFEFARRVPICHRGYMRKRSRKQEPEDINQIAHRMAQHVIEATEPDLSDEDTRKRLAQALGRLGGLKGGPARAAKLTDAQKRESASKAARARWAKRSD
jgi:hypothetical protein